ncbi:putative laccase-11 [Hordeum vulgare]|nr:putative laccase-11 [Hordeum vulgare]
MDSSFSTFPTQFDTRIEAAVEANTMAQQTTMAKIDDLLAWRPDLERHVIDLGEAVLEEIRTRHTARIAVGLPSDSPEPEEDEEEQQSILVKVAYPEEEDTGDWKEDETEELKEEPSPVAGFDMEDAMAEFVAAQTTKIGEPQTILESSRDEAYVEAKSRFI